MIELLQTANLPPMLMDRLHASYKIHNWAAAPDRDALLAEVGSSVRGALAGGMQGPDAALIGKLPNLEIIASFSVGFDATDVGAAQAKDVIVTHTPDVLTGDVADLAMSFILMAPRRISEAERFLRQGSWQKGRMDLGVSVRGRRLGIIGLGRIGRAVARRAEVFGMSIGYFDIKPFGDMTYRSYPTLLDLAAASDILLVACEGGAQTRDLVNADVLEALGSEGYLINTARGSIVDEPALISALQSGVIAGAALDVFDAEPNVPEALLALDNVTLTPHIASSTEETRRAMADLVCDNLAAHFAGKPVLTPVPRQI